METACWWFNNVFAYLTLWCSRSFHVQQQPLDVMMMSMDDSFDQVASQNYSCRTRKNAVLEPAKGA